MKCPKCRFDMDDVMIGSLRVVNAEINDEGKLDLTVEETRAFVASVAWALRTCLGDAPNYAEMELTGPDGKTYVLRIQRCEGKTPNDLRLESEARAGSLAGQLAAAREERRELQRQLTEARMNLARELAKTPVEMPT